MMDCDRLFTSARADLIHSTVLRTTQLNTTAVGGQQLDTVREVKPQLDRQFVTMEHVGSRSVLLCPMVVIQSPAPPVRKVVLVTVRPLVLGGQTLKFVV